MAKNQRQLWIRQFAIDDVEVGATDRAVRNANEQLTRGQRWLWNVAQNERCSGSLENHRAHVAIDPCLSYSSRNGLAHFAIPGTRRRGFVMGVRTAQERNAVKHMFLEPFEPEI